MNASQETERFFTRRQLIQRRGWTSVLCNFLPPPDETRANPVNVHAQPVKLYRESTIVDLERSEHFQSAQKIAAERKAAAAKATETKRAKLAAAIAAEPAPELSALNRGEIFRRALTAAAVDYLLDELEPYRRALVEKCRRSEVEEREKLIDLKILDAIAQRYPFLTDECDRRKKRT